MKPDSQPITSIWAWEEDGMFRWGFVKHECNIVDYFLKGKELEEMERMKNVRGPTISTEL